MNELVQMARGPVPTMNGLSQLSPTRAFELAIARCTPLVPIVPIVPFVPFVAMNWLSPVVPRPCLLCLLCLLWL